VLVEKGVSKVFAEQPQGAVLLDPVWPASIQPLLQSDQVDVEP